MGSSVKFFKTYSHLITIPKYFVTYDVSTTTDVWNFALEFLYEPNLYEVHKKQLVTINSFNSSCVTFYRFYRSQQHIRLRSTSLCVHFKFYSKNQIGGLNNLIDFIQINNSLKFKVTVRIQKQFELKYLRKFVIFGWWTINTMICTMSNQSIEELDQRRQTVQNLQISTIFFVQWVYSLSQTNGYYLTCASLQPVFLIARSRYVEWVYLIWYPCAEYLFCDSSKTFGYQ